MCSNYQVGPPEAPSTAPLCGGDRGLVGPYSDTEDGRQWGDTKIDVALRPGMNDKSAVISTATVTSTSSNRQGAGLTAPVTGHGPPALSGHHDSNEAVKLPKNATELIAWAIKESDTTTPTLTHIASHIQAHVPTYRDYEPNVLIKLVDHHLHKNTPTYFLPVMSPAGHVFHNPSLAKWAINRQTVVVTEDGSLLKRRHRPHNNNNSNNNNNHHSNINRRPGPSFSCSGTGHVYGNNSNNIFMAQPDSVGGPGSHLTSYDSPITNLSTSYNSAVFMHQNGGTMMNSATMSMYNTTSALPGMQTPLGTGLYGMPY